MVLSGVVTQAAEPRPGNQARHHGAVVASVATAMSVDGARVGALEAFRRVAARAAPVGSAGVSMVATPAVRRAHLDATVIGAGGERGRRVAFVAREPRVHEMDAVVEHRAARSRPYRLDAVVAAGAGLHVRVGTERRGCRGRESGSPVRRFGARQRELQQPVGRSDVVNSAAGLDDFPRTAGGHGRGVGAVSTPDPGIRLRRVQIRPDRFDASAHGVHPAVEKRPVAGPVTGAALRLQRVEALGAASGVLHRLRRVALHALDARGELGRGSDGDRLGRQARVEEIAEEELEVGGVDRSVSA